MFFMCNLLMRAFLDFGDEYVCHCLTFRCWIALVDTDLINSNQLLNNYPKIGIALQADKPIFNSFTHAQRFQWHALTLLVFCSVLRLGSNWCICTCLSDPPPYLIHPIGGTVMCAHIYAWRRQSWNIVNIPRISLHLRFV